MTDQFLYMVAGFIPIHSLYLYIVNFVILNVWYFIALANSELGSLIILLIDILVVAFAYGFVIYGIYTKYPKLNEAGFKNEDKLAVGLAANGIGMILTWLCVATSNNLATVLNVDSGLNDDVARATALVVLIIEYGVYVFLDIACLEKYFRFLYAPHIPFLLGLIGILSKQYAPNRPTSPIIIGKWTILWYSMCLRS